MPDMLGRLRGLLPASWFGHDVAPVRDTVLSGIAAPFTWGYSLYSFVTAQARLATSTGVFLDFFALDFLGKTLPRKMGEVDATYSARIAAELVRPRNTRAAVSQAIRDLTGTTPTLVEPWNTGDCAAIGYTFASGVGTPLGSLSLTDQVFVTVGTPSVTLVGFVSAWPGLDLFFSPPIYTYSGTQSAALQADAGIAGVGTAAGGVGSGALATIGSAGLGNASQAEINTALLRNLAAGIRAWVQVH